MSSPRAKVAILRTRPETVLSDYHQLLNLAGYVRQFAFMTIAAGLIAPNPIAAVAGVAVLAVAIAFVENAFARLRLFEIPQLLLTGILLAVVSVAVRAV